MAAKKKEKPKDIVVKKEPLTNAVKTARERKRVFVK